MPDFGFGGIASVGAVVTVALTFFFLFIAIAKRYKKVGPNEVMIISGRNTACAIPTAASRSPASALAKAAARSSARCSSASICCRSR